jgi:hypothetical protein
MRIRQILWGLLLAEGLVLPACFHELKRRDAGNSGQDGLLGSDTGTDGVPITVPFDGALDGRGVDGPSSASGGTGGFDVGSSVSIDASDVPLAAGGSGGGGSGGASLGGNSGSGGSGVLVDAPADQKQSSAPGASCTGSGDCASGVCLDGICCAGSCSGCNACSNTLTGAADGTCAPVLAGKNARGACKDETANDECGNDGTCDGTGACRKVGTSHVCRQSSCSASGVFTPKSTCDGLGKCKPPATEDCAPFQCGTDGCLKSCTKNDDCNISTSYCKITSGTTGTCTAKNPNGTSATQDYECTSGIVADGLCCDQACTGCRACSGSPLTSAPAGQCSNVVAGQVAHNACTASGTACGLDGKCDGAGSCRYSPAEGAACDDPANLCVTGRVCENHACTAGSTKACTAPSECHTTTGATCTPATGQCSYPNASNGSSCTGDGSVCATHACQNGTCVATAKTCPSSPECHTTSGASCDLSTGQCVYPNAMNGSSCTGDGNVCSTHACQGGSCIATPILCNNPPACKVSTTCSAGQCNYTQNAQDGTTDSKCTGGPYCLSGNCVQCLSDAQCTSLRRSCDPSTHKCVCMLPSSGNLLQNPGFNGSLAKWTTGLYASYSTVDSDGCPESGSVYIDGSSEGDPVQCLPAVTPGKQYYVGLRSRGGNPGGMIRIHYWSGPNCTGTIISTEDPFHFSTPPDNTSWLPYNGGFTPPGGTVSADFAVFAWNQWLDQMYVNVDGQWF